MANDKSELRKFLDELKPLSAKEKYAETQPKAGDHFVHCGHTAAADAPLHFWTASIDFVRPDGSAGHATWTMCCHTCFQQAGGDLLKLQIRGDGTWPGNEPIILEPGET